MKDINDKFNEFRIKFINNLRMYSSLPSEYGWVLIVGALIGFQIILIGFIFPGRARGRIFTQEFMESNFGAEHKQRFSKDIQNGGYPDMGCGRYSQKLSYQEWYNFNNAQRVHYNFIEYAPSIFVFLFVAGLYFPVSAAAIGLAIIIFRAIYAIGYSSGGPGSRVLGAVAAHFCWMGLFGLSLASGAMLIQGNSSP